MIEPPKCEAFKVPKRIIGPSGNNMSRIVNKCKRAFGKKVTKLIKLRLRGKGSDMRNNN